MPQKKNNSRQTKVSAERNGDKPQNAYFLSLELENVRCFGEKQPIDFSDGYDNPKQWTIILGDNGTGKTTLLQYLARMLPLFYEVFDTEGRLDKSVRPKDVELSKDFFTRKWAKRMGLPVNHILDIYLNISIQKTLEINSPKSLLSYGNNRSRFPDGFIEFKVNFFAYGASRKAGKTSLSEQNEESSYITLFDETPLLINPEEWFLQADYASKRESEFSEKRNQQLKTVIEILKKILPDVDNIRIRDKEFVDKEETLYKRLPQPIVEFHTPYGWVESKDLSLGYRTSMAWMVDFASRMFDLYPESENPLDEPAVVLIDEIDLHLHPKWQRELIDYLTNLFPNTQFIVTTHSPLIVQAAARDANIVVCRRDDDHVVIDQSVEAVRNWRTDQILTSDLFELPTDRPIEIEPYLEERQKILSKAKLTKRDQKRLEELEGKIGSVPMMKNPKYDEAMDIILRAAEKLGKENGVSNDSHKKTSKSSEHSKK